MKGEKMSKYYLSIHFDKNGKLVGVDPPEGKKIKKERVSKDGEFETPINGVNQLQTVTIVGNAKGSPCCIVVDSIKICWPPCC